MSKLPTFLIIAVQKAGTTSIYNYLKQHPQVYMSPVKETNFLEKDWENLTPEIGAKKKNRIDTFAKYSQLFQDVKEEIAIGEASPNYLFHYQTSSECISRYVPNVKMIAILRDPAQRAYSDYLMHIRDVIGNGRSLSDQIKYSRHKSFMIRKGFYYEPLKHYFEKFGIEKFRVYLYEDLCKNPVNMMQNMYQFIGVDHRFSPDTSRKNQIGKIPKLKFLNALLRAQNNSSSLFHSILNPIFPVESRRKILSNLIERNLQDKSNFPLSSETRKQLVTLYREDILKLQDLIQRDLSKWLEY